MKLGVLAAALSAGALLSAGWFTSLTATVPERDVSGRPVQIADQGYTSSAACQACHPREYATWHESYHRTMTDLARPETVATSFDNVEVKAVTGQPMLLHRRGAELWATLDDPDASSRDARRPRIERRVVMTTGSHHQQIYWYETGRGRLLGQLPAEYLIDEHRWIPRSTVLMHPPVPPFSETGSWNSTCIACHTTLAKPRLLTPPGVPPNRMEANDTQSAEFGIACEACHGPSDEHVRANQSPLRRYRLRLGHRRDELTVLPDQLNPARSSQVCGQCHSVWEFLSQTAERQANASGLPYRPGDELSATRMVVQPTHASQSRAMSEMIADDPQFIKDSFWSDGMIRVSGREYNGLIESPCYKDARTDGEKLSCFSCHQMHRRDDDPRSAQEWAANQLAPRMDGNAACLQCHQSYAANITAHSKHAATSSGSSCYNCHMPYTTYGLLKTLRSHQVSSPSVAASINTGRPNACNLCHLDKTLKWTADALTKMYGIESPALSRDESEIAASLLWLLRGDAGQRAVVAQSMAWKPARDISGTQWMAPYLAPLLNDPYEALRFIVARSLRSTPGFDHFEYDYRAGENDRADASKRALETWQSLRDKNRRLDPELLFDADGNVNVDAVDRLIAARDNRPVFLRE